MPRREDLEKKQRIVADLMDGMESKAAALKYGCTRDYINRLYRQAFGPRVDREKDKRLAELEQRLKTLEVIVNTYFKERLTRAGL